MGEQHKPWWWNNEIMSYTASGEHVDLGALGNCGVRLYPLCRLKNGQNKLLDIWSVGTNSKRWGHILQQPQTQQLWMVECPEDCFKLCFEHCISSSLGSLVLLYINKQMHFSVVYLWVLKHLTPLMWPFKYVGNTKPEMPALEFST